MLGAELETQLVGAVFAENALAAASVGLALGEPANQVKAGILALARVPGRFEIVAESPVVVVDYAHTPDALTRTCEAARDLGNEQPGRARVIVVFGAGGNRDKTKRVPMGESVGALADIAIVTSDNPRDEEPAAIAQAVASGCHRGGKCHVVLELDRRRAIERALETANPYDIVVICGKGHETGQTQRGVTLPFDDATVAREFLGLSTR
jgi:UDP-N-acetylmuramoyl-L-alanyl-D-glutamate--2,6-diaminopimelate ligase